MTITEAKQNDKYCVTRQREVGARAEANFAWVSGDKRCHVTGGHGMCFYVTR